MGVVQLGLVMGAKVTIAVTMLVAFSMLLDTVAPVLPAL
jgi:hypothetical protein